MIRSLVSRTSLVALLGLSIFLLPGTTRAEGKRRALLVGARSYDHSKLEPLEFTENDVTELAALLRPAGYEVTLLTDTIGKREASLLPTRANILRSLRAILEPCKRDDLVLVAFAGHGIQFDKDPDSYFCPRDAKPFRERADTLVSLNSVYKALDDCGAGVKLLVVDACRNDPTPGRGRGIDAGRSAPPPRGVYALYSCSPGERAYEHKNLKHGIFFHYLLQGLRGAARDSEEGITFEGLALYVRRQVPKRVPELIDGARQTPILRISEASGESPLVVARGAGDLQADVAGFVASLRLHKSAAPFLLKATAERRARWRQAAEQGVAAGQLLYGAAIWQGVGVPEDAAGGARLLRAAAEQGLAPAQVEIAWAYQNGLGVAQNAEEAFRWYRRAAAQGHGRGQIFVGECYANGIGVPQDAREAVRWYRLAAEKGEPIAQNFLGWAYLNGFGVTRDEKAAVGWFRKAAALDNSDALFNLGHVYEAGAGVERDTAEAVRWYRKAAARGHADAAEALKRLPRA